MNICIICRSLPHHRAGGLEYHATELARRLAARNHQVVLLTTGEQSSVVQHYYDDVTVETIPGTKPGAYSLHYFRALQNHIALLHQKYHFDLLHGQGFGALTINPRKIGIPLVVTIHGTLFSETALARTIWRRLTVSEKLNALWRHKARVLLIPWYRCMLRRTSAIIVDSNFTREEIIYRQPQVADKIRLVRLGIDASRFQQVDKESARNKLGLPRDTVIFFTVGRLHKLKGIQTVIKALKYIHDEKADLPAHRYLIGGIGEYYRELSTMMESLGIQDRVVFLGKVRDEDLPWYYAAADAFIHPELSQPAFGLVALESLLCGTPVIGSRNGAIPEIVDDSVGMLFPPDDAWSLSQILIKVLRRPETLGELQKVCRSYALAKFPTAEMARATESVYKEVLNKPR